MGAFILFLSGGKIASGPEWSGWAVAPMRLMALGMCLSAQGYTNPMDNGLPAWHGQPIYSRHSAREKNSGRKRASVLSIDFLGDVEEGGCF